MNMNTPQIPWNPVHPAMIPLTQETIETGLSCIKALREKHFATRRAGVSVNARDGFARQWVASFGENHIEQNKNINAIADERAEPQVTADIAALSSLDNQKLGLYQHA